MNPSSLENVLLK